MFTNNAAERAIGILSGFTGRWNPLSRIVHLLVNVNGNTLRVPIDHRQMQFIRKEYDIGSEIELQFYEGNWHVISSIQPSCDMRMIESHQALQRDQY
jgi:hypothetical protein